MTSYKKLVDHFLYIGRNISSTECDINIGLVKLWNGIDRLLIWTIDLSDEIKRGLFQALYL